MVSLEMALEQKPILVPHRSSGLAPRQWTWLGLVASQITNLYKSSNNDIKGLKHEKIIHSSQLPHGLRGGVVKQTELTFNFRKDLLPGL